MDIKETVSYIFGPDLPLESDAKSTKEKSRSLRVTECLESVDKYIQSTLKKSNAREAANDDRPGRLGPNIVKFDVTSRVGLFSISSDRLSINARSDFSTVKANVAVFKGKWMYEMQLGSKGLMQIGWSTSKCIFGHETGVGDTINSYSYDGNRVRKWNIATHKYGEPWLSGDFIGSTIDIDEGTIHFYRNGVHLGQAFDNVATGPGFAYFPTVSLALAEGLTANFGGTPIHYPVAGYEPLQLPPIREVAQATCLFKWLMRIVDRMDELVPDRKTVLDGEKMSERAFLMCLAGFVVKHIGPLITIPYITEHVIVAFIQELADADTSSRLVTCFDLFWSLLEEQEIRTCLENIILSLLSALRHVSHLLEYSHQCERLKLLTKICQHVSTRQYLLQHLLFEQVRLPNFLNVKPPDKGALAAIVSNVWWETIPVCEVLEANKKYYFDSCDKIKCAISELETLQVELIITLLDNSDGSGTRPTSRTIFLRKFNHFVPIANSNPSPITLCCVYRLLAAFKILWDTEVRTLPVFVPCSVFYDGTVDYSRSERLGGVMSHLQKTYRGELVRLLGAEHNTITSIDETQDSTNRFPGLTLVRMINISALGQGTSMILDATPLPLNTVDPTTSLLNLLDSIILFYHIVAKKSLAKVALLRNSMTEYVSAVQDMRTRIEIAEGKNDLEAGSIKEELLRAIGVFNIKLSEQARHMAWIRAAVYSEEKQLLLAWLLNVVILTLKNASTEGNMFSFVPDFYLEALADLCVGLRNHMHPTAPVENIPNYQNMFLSVAEFLCEHFMDPRIVNANSKSTLLLTLAGFVFNPITLEALENVPEESRVKLIRNLIKSYENRAWAESNWILVRFWQGEGFAFRYERSPHLSKRVGPKQFQQESISQPRKPCPSAIYQGHVRDVLLQNSQETTSFLNSLLNLLNWTFSEFIGMVQEIHNVSSRPERVYIESRQLKICATCFDLTISLLRVLEMITTVIPNIFDSPQQSFSENLLFRLCQLLCQLLNRMSSQSSCFQHLVLLDIPDLESVDHFPILAAVIGILLALLKEDMINFRPKSMTEVPKITQTLINEPSFQINTLYFTLGETKEKGRQEKKPKQFSFLNYPNDVTEEEIKRVKNMIEYLDECSAILPNSKASSDNNDTCTICYAQPIAVTFKPCNHQTCRICIDRHLLNTRSCFFCKATIEKVIDLSGNVLHEFSSGESSSK